MNRFVVKYAPIREDDKTMDQYFVYDTRDCKFIVGYMDEPAAQKAVDRANLLVAE
jgi:hypothetical protein